MKVARVFCASQQNERSAKVSDFSGFGFKTSAMVFVWWRRLPFQEIILPRMKPRCLQLLFFCGLQIDLRNLTSESIPVVNQRARVGAIPRLEDRDDSCGTH